MTSSRNTGRRRNPLLPPATEAEKIREEFEIEHPRLWRIFSGRSRTEFGSWAMLLLFPLFFVVYWLSGWGQTVWPFLIYGVLVIASIPASLTAHGIWVNWEYRRLSPELKAKLHIAVDEQNRRLQEYRDKNQDIPDIDFPLY